MKLGPVKLFDKFEVPNLDDPTAEPYLTRWRLIECPWFGVLLHKFGGPDSRPVLHDHPWSFVSIILRGGYIEHRLDPKTRVVKVRHRRWINVMRRDDAHFIQRLDRTPSWSLLFIGRRRRTWGYWRRKPIEFRTFDRHEWVWTPFDQDRNGELFDRAMAERVAAGLSEDRRHA